MLKEIRTRSLTQLARGLLPPGQFLEQVSSFGVIALILLLILQQSSPNFGVLTAVLGIFSALLLFLVFWKRSLLIPQTVVIPFFLFVLVVILTSFATRVPEESLAAAVYYTSLLAAFILGFQLTIRNKNFIFWFTKTFVFLGILIVLGFFVEELISGRLSEGGRFIGPFYWHNQMAAFLIFLLPLSLAYFLLQKKSKFFLWATINIFLIAALLLTQSRASWLSFGISIIPALIVARRLFRQRLKVLALFALGLLILLPLLPHVGRVAERIESISQEIRGETRSVSGNLRLTVYASSLDMFKDHPLFGVGPGAFGEAFRVYQGQPWLYAKYTHNHFLQVAAEMGILGIVTFLTIFLGLVFIIKKYGKGVFNKAAKGEKRAVLLSAFGIALLASFLHNLLDTDWNWPSLAFLFWFTTGVFVAGLYPSTKRAFSLNFSFAKKIIAFFLFIILLSFSFYLFVVERNLQSGKVTFFNEEYEESLKYFSRVAKIFPLSYTSYLFQGRIEHLGGNYDQALNHYKKAASLNPFTAEPVFGEGIILEKREQKKKAEKKFRKASYINPFSDPKYYQKVAELRLQEGDLDGAEKVLQKAIEVAFPMNESYQGFSYLYTTTGFSQRLAETYFRYAIVLIRQEKYSQAAKIVNLALTNLAEDDPGLKLLEAFLQTKLSQ